MAWTTSSGLGIQYTSTAGQPTPITSTFPPSVFQTFAIDEQYSTSSPPEIRQPQPRRPYTTIAPNPAGVAAAKRRRDEEHDADPATSSSKKRTRTSSVVSADLSEHDRFLVQLKEDENLPWKDIVTRFHTDKGKDFQVAALQMRYKRLREKFRVWEERDVMALRTAHEYWEKYKWEIISAKVGLLRDFVNARPQMLTTFPDARLWLKRTVASTTLRKKVAGHGHRCGSIRNDSRHDAWLVTVLEPYRRACTFCLYASPLTTWQRLWQHAGLPLNFVVLGKWLCFDTIPFTFASSVGKAQIGCRCYDWLSSAF